MWEPMGDQIALYPALRRTSAWLLTRQHGRWICGTWGRARDKSRVFASRKHMKRKKAPTWDALFFGLADVLHSLLLQAFDFDLAFAA